ncbi:putative trehalose-phosphate phosphatase [Agaricicola taiwanensis]|uniref:Trehalose 6-phosphate phosphatase n=1 Tax=Agaricicola taiwanensis TaxID=591372 RepID=A0A8J2YGR5_9RHOB|nr:trehalose-phosphatase [Agaricicola taiwanensis]GGE37374.1 putative trehalose-phosphate phosphatase [Agaricicola taiwanensis]
MTIDTAEDAVAKSDPDCHSRPLPEDLTGWALFLDIDGTLLDLAAAPTEVVVPEWMPGALERLSRRLDGALALVTGRALENADELFTPHRFAVAGLHGADIRFASGQMHMAPRSSFLDPLRNELASLAALNPGLVLEDKQAGVAIHYRLAPKFGDGLIAKLTNFAEASAGAFEVQLGKMVVEVRPAGANKGTAVTALLSQPPFQGRKPLAIGDDLTDEAMFVVVNAYGGRAVRVGRPDRPTVATAEVDQAEDVRNWLERIAA